MKSSSIMNGIYAICEWIMRFSVINLLWLVFNFPIVWIAISLIFADHKDEVLFLSPIIALLAPFVFFPGTQAMFAVVRDWIIGRDSKSLISSYWHYYKENYRKSMVAGAVITLIFSGLIINIVYFSQSNVLFMFLMVFIGVIFLIFTVNFFSVSAHFELRLKNLVKNTFAVTFGSPLLFFTILICGALLFIISFQAWYVFIFFAGSLFAFLSFSAFYRLFIKLKNEAKQ